MDFLRIVADILELLLTLMIVSGGGRSLVPTQCAKNECQAYLPSF